MYIEVKNGKPGNPREYKGEQWGEVQCALFGEGLDYPIPFRLNRKVSDSVTPGRYALDPTGFATDNFGNLQLSKVRLGAAVK